MNWKWGWEHTYNMSTAHHICRGGRMVVIWIIHLQNFSHMYNVTCLIKGDKMDGLIRNQFRARYSSVEWKRAVYYRLLFFLLWLPGYRRATYVSFEHCVPFLPPSLTFYNCNHLRWSDGWQVAMSDVFFFFFFLLSVLNPRTFLSPRTCGPYQHATCPPIDLWQGHQFTVPLLVLPKTFFICILWNVAYPWWAPPFEQYGSHELKDDM